MRAPLIILALVTSTALATPVTYRTSGATARQVIVETAALAGEKWEVDDELAREILVVGVDKIEPERLRSKMATVLSGKWVRRNDGTLLLEDDVVETRRRNEVAQKEFVRWVRKRVDEMITNLEEIAFREGSIATHELSRLQPLYILRQIGDTSLEKLSIGERIVLSTHPNRSQSALSNVLPMVNALNVERSRRMVEAAKKENPGVIMRILNTETSSCVFAIERFAAEHVGLTYSFGGGGEGFSAIRPEFATSTAQPTGERIAWSDVSRELSRVFRNPLGAVPYGLVPMSRKTIDALRNPTRNDPLSFTFGEGILAYAHGSGLDVVACIPDDEFSWDLAFAQDGITAASFYEQVRSRSALTTASDTEWLLVYPLDPVAAREFRGNRVALKKLIDSTSDGSYPALDDLAEMASAHLPLGRAPIPFKHIFVAMLGADGGGVSDFEYNPTTWRGLQFYHTLTPSIRTRLRNREELRIAVLPPASKDVLKRMLFGAPRSQFGEFPEPTVAMPNGLPSDGKIKAEVTSEPILAPLPDGGKFETPSKPLGPRQVARIRIDIERNVPTISLNRVRFGERIIWSFTVFAPDGTIVGKTAVCEDKVDPKGKILTMSQVPEAVIKSFAEAERIERIRLFGG